MTHTHTARNTSPSAALLLNRPPAYLALLPTSVLKESGATQRWAAKRILSALRELNIAARPTLEQVEAERVRRGLRGNQRASLRNTA